MRDSLNYTMLPPAVQDNCLTYSRNGTITTLPSNGYYGYQPPINSDDNRIDNKHTNDGRQQQQMDVVMQFEEYDNRRRFETVNNRKRCWEISGDVRQFKKRRQNCDVYNYDTSPTSTHQPASATPTTGSSREVVWLRKPTHNLPDMPRCIMGHYI